jgi:hypothetical protein
MFFNCRFFSFFRLEVFAGRFLFSEELSASGKCAPKFEVGEKIFSLSVRPLRGFREQFTGKLPDGAKSVTIQFR